MKSGIHLHTPEAMPPVRRRLISISRLEGICPACNKRFQRTLATHLRRHSDCKKALQRFPALEAEGDSQRVILNEYVRRPRRPAHADDAAQPPKFVEKTSFLPKDTLIKMHCGLSSEAELRVVDFITKHGIKNSAASNLLSLIKELKPCEVKALPWTIAPLYRKLDSKLNSNLLWKDGISFSMERIPIPKNFWNSVDGLKEFYVPFSSPHGFISSMKSWLPLQELVIPKLDGSYGVDDGLLPFLPRLREADVHTGKAIKRLTHKVRSLYGKPKLHVMGLIIYIDSACTRSRGTRTATPVYITVSIASQHLRNLRESKTLVMYIPKFWDSELGSDGTRIILNLAMDFLLNNFKAYCSQPFLMEFESKVNLLYYVCFTMLQTLTNA
jgi:hypothetical protein